MRRELDTSAFLPCRGRVASAYQNQWQRFVLECDDETWERIIKKRDELIEQDSRHGTLWRYRKYDRWVVGRYGV